MPVEDNNRATALGNVHRKFTEVQTSGCFKYAHGQTDRQTDMALQTC